MIKDLKNNMYIADDFDDYLETEETSDVNTTTDLNSNFIKNYVNEGSFAFVAQIATAEDMDEASVIACALKYNYKIYSVKNYTFEKLIIADKDVKAETISELFGDYLIGNAKVFEIK